MEMDVMTLYADKTEEVLSKKLQLCLYCRSAQTFSRTIHPRTRPVNYSSLMVRVPIGVAAVIISSWMSCGRSKYHAQFFTGVVSGVLNPPAPSICMIPCTGCNLGTLWSWVALGWCLCLGDVQWSGNSQGLPSGATWLECWRLWFLMPGILVKISLSPLWFQTMHVAVDPQVPGIYTMEKTSFCWLFWSVWRFSDVFPAWAGLWGVNHQIAILGSTWWYPIVLLPIWIFLWYWFLYLVTRDFQWWKNGMDSM